MSNSILMDYYTSSLSKTWHCAVCGVVGEEEIDGRYMRHVECGSEDIWEEGEESECH